MPYKGGGPAVVALASGEIQAMTATIGSLMPHLPSNRIRAPAVTPSARLKSFSNILTIAKGGVAGYDFSAWIGSFVAANTPWPIVDRLNAELKKALGHPAVIKNLSGQTLDPMHMSPEQFAARLKSDYDNYDELVKRTGANIN